MASFACVFVSVITCGSPSAGNRFQQGKDANTECGADCSACFEGMWAYVYADVATSMRKRVANALCACSWATVHPECAVNARI